MNTPGKPTLRTLATVRTLPTALALALALALTACGGKDDKTPASQVAAKVNSEEISVHQINFMLGRSNAANVSPEQAPKLRREILDKLVEQQLAVEQALERKLDRSPDVIMAVDAARREILARAYIEQLAGAVSKPSAEEARTYYKEHPPLFAERRVFNIQEIVLASDPAVTAQLRELVAAGKPMDEIANWLKGKDIKFNGGSATRPAENIPLDLLPKIHALKDGQSVVIESPQSTTVIRVVASQAVPVTEAAAQPRIQQYLANQRGAEAAVNELKQVRAKAKITYVGEFASAEGAAAAAPQAAAPAAPAAAMTPAEPAKPGEAAMPAAATPETKPAVSSTIEKGVAGLK